MPKKKQQEQSFLEQKRSEKKATRFALEEKETDNDDAPRNTTDCKDRQLSVCVRVGVFVCVCARGHRQSVISHRRRH